MTREFIPLKGKQLALVEHLEADNDRLRALLGKLRWKSTDKDNMEFRCDTTCHVVDEIRRALETKMNNDTATYHARQERGDGHMPPGEGAAFANGAAARQPEIDRLCAERLAFATESEERKAEIERLQAHAKSMVDALNADIDDKAAEIKRLRAEIARLTGIATAFPMTDIGKRLRKRAEDNLDPGNALVREAADAIDRLTALLTDIHDDGRCPSWICIEIERAQEPKP